MTSLPPGFRYEVSPAGCWLWSGYCDKNGYARIYNRQRKRIEWAHRFSYEAHKGPIPTKHEIDHVCEQTNCVNPEHLDSVTRVEHARRTMERLGKDRQHLAAAHLRRMKLTYSEIAEVLGYTSKSSAYSAVRAAVDKGLIEGDEVPPVYRLTEVEREEIRDLYAVGIPQPVIGLFYDIDSSQVSRICSGRSSGHRGRAA